MPSVLITDADTGLGLELVRHYAAKGYAVHAACAGTPGVGWPEGDIKALHYDAQDPAAAAQLAGEIGETALDIVIVNSATARGSDLNVADITRAGWSASVTAGTFAAAKLAIALHGNLGRGAMKKLVALSSFSASIGDCQTPTPYGFRASKAALNSLWRTFSVEWRQLGICCLIVAPDQGASGDTATASSLFKLIDQATPQDSGEFFAADGGKIPW